MLETKQLTKPTTREMTAADIPYLKLEPDKDLEEMRELIRKDEKEREKEIIYVPYPVPTPQPYYPRYPWVTYTGMGTAVKLGEEQPSSQYE